VSIGKFAEDEKQDLEQTCLPMELIVVFIIRKTSLRRGISDHIGNASDFKRYFVVTPSFSFLGGK